MDESEESSYVIFLEVEESLTKESQEVREQFLKRVREKLKD